MSPRPLHRFAHLPSQLNPFFPESGENNFVRDVILRGCTDKSKIACSMNNLKHRGLPDCHGEAKKGIQTAPRTQASPSKSADSK